MPSKKYKKRFTKRIYSFSHLSYAERLAAINLESLELRKLKNDLGMYYKCLNNLVALPSDEYFCQRHQVSQTRSGGGRLTVPSCSTNHLGGDLCLLGDSFSEVKARRPRPVLGWVSIREDRTPCTCVRSSVWTLICDRFSGQLSLSSLTGI